MYNFMCFQSHYFLDNLNPIWSCLCDLSLQFHTTSEVTPHFFKECSLPENLTTTQRNQSVDSLDKPVLSPCSSITQENSCTISSQIKHTTLWDGLMKFSYSSHLGQLYAYGSKCLLTTIIQTELNISSDLFLLHQFLFLSPQQPTLT